MGLTRLDHLNRLGMIVPDHIDIRARIRFLKGAGEGFDGGKLRSISNDHQIARHLGPNPGRECGRQDEHCG
jgi:hypothetical protein